MTTHTLQTPPRGDERPWVAVQIEALTDSGWRVIQATTVAPRARSVSVTCREQPEGTRLRAVWVAEGGTAAGLHVEPVGEPGRVRR